MQRSFQILHSSKQRHGVTLTEVLVSMMIMAIGVLMVMSLFPLAALRTLQANQLTNATILRYNIESLIAQDPRLVFDPNRDSNFDEHVQQSAQRNYIVDPLSFHVYAQDFMEGSPTLSDFAFFGNDGATVPASTTFSIPRFGAGLITAAGDDWSVSVADAKALRFFASNFASQPDGWITDIDTFATAVETDGTGVIGVKLGNLSASELQNVGSSNSVNTLTPFVGKVTDPEQYRIVVFDTDEKISQAFPLTFMDKEDGLDPEIGSADSDIEASWSERGVAAPLDFNLNLRSDARYLPVEFGGTVGRVLLQSRRASEFNWMLTVRRRADGNARSVDVVVKFKNGVDSKDEELFYGNCLGGTNIIGVKKKGDVNGSGAIDSGEVPNGDGGLAVVEPRLKKGGFAFDVVNSVWYRITDVLEKPAFGGAGTFSWDEYDYRVSLETEIRTLESTGADSLDNGLLDGTDTSTFGRVMFPTGVIEVYPLGSKQFPDSLR